jgi:AraC family transcriptional regulator
MDFSIAETTQAHSTASVLARHPAANMGAKHSAPVMQAGCPVMRVTYRVGVPEQEWEQSDGEIKILVPGEQAALHVMHATADGRQRMIFVRGHHISVVPPNQPHAFRSQRQSDLIVIRLDRRFFEEKVREALGIERAALTERYAAVDPFLTETGRMLKSEFQMRRTPSVTYLESLAAVIAIHLAKHYGDGQQFVPDHVGLPPHKLSQAKAFIEEHLDEGIGVKEVAAAINMSPFHFSRMFKLATRRSPYQYITLRRIDRAKELLSNTRLPLIEVAASVGFQTQGHFTSVFHKFTGMTPRVFRLSCQNADSICLPRVQQ